ncbi:serine/threonine-protein kinase RIO3 [Anoplophora glabripennis]|uniref:serine/threonine-protein kinase RIO3 n=1 Tax=Anoplophora glabripennis TaxID=217634 RepID=UPI000874CDBA|nr:serine/threonine-protein kinase RIO3 [Anoplophora glabripennis]
MSCPWAKIEKPEPVNFADILSEEVAKDLQAKEDKKLVDMFNEENQVEDTEAAVAALVEDIPTEILKAISDDSFESDAMIAQMLQMQFDKEYDQELKRKEEKYNGSSKVSISFDNYRRVPLNNDFESESEEEEITDIRDRKDWDRFDPLEKEIASIPACGYKMQKDGKMITKHDIVMNGRKNACKLLSFPPEFQTGDGEMFDLKLSNKVFNSLKMHSRNEQARRHKLHDKKEHATAVFGMDQHTRLLLYKMIINQLLQGVNGVISVGKEAVILHAALDPSFPYATENWPTECAIKVFKTTLSEFKQRDRYIKDDHRFKERFRNQTTRKSIQLWAEKEMANLMRLKRIGIPCPEVIKLREHVLVMSFIGKDNLPAPKLKDAVMSDADFIAAYEEVKNAMKLLYEEANLIHADLSEYNILWHEGQCYFIDVSQSVEPSHENAFRFLHRDCINITTFFGKRISEIESPDELFKFVTGFYISDKIALESLTESFKMKPHLVDKPGVESSYDFDTAWEKVKAGEVPIDVEVEKAVSDLDLNLVEPPKA